MSILSLRSPQLTRDQLNFVTVFTAASVVFSRLWPDMYVGEWVLSEVQQSASRGAILPISWSMKSPRAALLNEVVSADGW